MDIRREENNLDCPVDAGGGDGGCGGGGGSGVRSTSINFGGANEVVRRIYRDDVSSYCVGGENFASSSTNSQPFDIFAASYSTTTPYKSPEGMAFPFTSSQWKELQTQAMIYKYIISSVPIPPDLLFPLSRNFPAAPSSVYNVGCPKNGDLEPGRCKRTDGKKWRCSREVAPNQKYCERHLHRGRPRSRKPVEAKNVNGENHKKTRLQQRYCPNSAADKDQPLLLFNDQTDLPINRDLGLSEEDKMTSMDGAEKRQQHFVERNVEFANEGSSLYGSTAAIFHQDYVEQQLQLNMLSCSNFSPQEIEAPNAWSTDYYGNLSSLNLSIAMAAGNFIDAEMGNFQIGHVSWEPFARGGPLAEALQPGLVAVGCMCMNPASPYDSTSTPATTVSSPSGVLHRTLFSHSDSSVCNSPTFAVPTSEIAFQWLN